MVNILVYILGIIAFCVAVFSMLFKEKSKIILCLTIYNILMLITYLLLGRYLGCVLIGIETIRSITYFIYSLKKLKPNIFVYIFFNIVGIGASVLFWASWVDIFVLINLIINTYSTWQTNVTIIKLGIIICTIFYITYDLIVGAYIYIISELAFGVSAVFSLIKNKKIESEMQLTTTKKDT